MATSETGQAANDRPVDVPEEEFAGLKRRLTGFEHKLFFVIGAGFTLYHLVVLNFYPQEALLFRATHVAWGAILGLALYRPFSASSDHHVPWYDWVLIALSIACCAYIYWELDGLLFRAGALPDPLDTWVGLVGTIIVLEFARRTAGLPLLIICGIFVGYVFVGPFMPGVLYHRGFEWERFFAYIYSDLGVFGTTTEASSNFIVLFVAFAAFLQISKVGDYFNDLSLALFGTLRGGPAKATVASGVLFGSISGSSVANVVASGVITIPMMRRVGYDRVTAGAVEATSSTGGQITPPVLGAGAFLMAEITGIAYGEIAFAAIIPCVLFYVACYAHVELHARLKGLRGLPRSELPSFVQLARRAFLFAPLVVMVWMLVAGYSPFRSASFAIVTAILVGWLDRQTRKSPHEIARALAALAAIGAAVGAVTFLAAQIYLWRYGSGLDVWFSTRMGALAGIVVGMIGLERGTQALSDAARDCLQLVAVCAAAGIIVGVIALTGIGGRFAQLLLQLAGENVLYAMIFTMVVALILGMGMPTTAAYAIAAAVLAPGLQRLGVPPLVAHMFIFYYAVVSSITPPVALAAFAAAAIARADPWKTGFVAVKMGLAVFIVPFMFFYSPVLLGQGTLLQTIPILASAIVGVIVLACATEGWFGRPISWVYRAPLALAAILLIAPEPISSVVGLIITVVVFFAARLRPSAPPPDAGARA